MKQKFTLFISGLILTSVVLCQPATDFDFKLQVGNSGGSATFLDVVQDSDGSIIAVGYGSGTGGELPSNHQGGLDVLIAKFNAQHSLVWAKYWGGTGADVAYSVIINSEGNYVVVGKVAESSGTKKDGFILILEPDGTIANQEIIGTAGYDDEISEVINTNSGYVTIGTSSSPSEAPGDLGGVDRIWLTNWDFNLALSWQKFRGYGDGSSHRGYSIKATSDGGLIMSATTNSPEAPNFHGGTDVMVLYATMNATVLWAKCIGGSGSDTSPNSIIETSDGGYAVIAETASTDGDIQGHHGGIADVMIARLNSSGDVQSVHVYGGSDYEGYGSTRKGLCETPSGKLVAVVNTKSSNGDISTHFGGYDGWIFQINSAGVIEWEKSMGGTSDDFLSNVIVANDGGILVCGKYNDKQGWIRKYKSESLPAAIDHDVLFSDILIYPNPAEDVLHIPSEEGHSVVGVFDLMGREIMSFSESIKDGNINISSLSAGIYLLRIIGSDNNIRTLKFEKK